MRSSDDLYNVSMIFYSSYAILYNYLFRGKDATMLPHWGSIGYMPCLRVLGSVRTKKNSTDSDGTTELELWGCNLDNYIGYRDKTALIVLGAYKDQYSLFCATDRLWTYRGHTVDIEVGIGWKYKSNGGKELLGLFGLQGTFRLHEYCSLKVAVSRKTPGCKEGITASGDGWTVSGGITLHI